MKKRHLNSVFFLFIVVLSACESESSADVNQDRIYTRYILTYYAGSGQTVARARFRFGNSYGTLLELNAPSTITMNDKRLEFIPLFGYYEKTISEKVSEGTFKWISFEEKEYIKSR